MATEIGNTAERVAESLKPDLEYFVSRVAERYADRCESPIELMMATAFEVSSQLSCEPIFEIVGAGGERKTKSICYIYPQFEWEGYRIDFYLEVVDKSQRVFVECDGHDFHERTADQAERDRAKDRLAQEQGIAILRFTGREIYRSPAGCVIQVLDFLNARAKARAIR